MRLLTLFIIISIPSFFLGQTEATLLGTWSDDSIIPAFLGRYNEVWGHALEGREYAIIGSSFGTHFIEVTDPSFPIEVARVAGATSGSSVTHRDFHNYGDYLYAVADEGASSTLQIMDLSTLPDTVIVVYDSAEFFFNVHNIFIDTAKARMYTLNTSTFSGFWPMQLYDISNPANPALLGSYRSFGGIALSQVHDAYVKNDTAFINAANTGLLIVNFADPENPELLSSLLDYPDQGYNHSGWASDDLHYYFLADETYRTRIKNIDISVISEPEVVGFTNVRDTIKDELPHNPIWHCDHLYVSSYYDMLQVYDVSDPTSPERVLFYDDDDGPNNGQFRGAWGVYPFLPSGNILLSSISDGLLVFEGLELENCGTPIISSTTQKIHTRQINIYPNPSDGYYTIELEGKLSVNIEVYDARGTRHLTVTDINSTIIDLTFLPSGIYSIIISDLSHPSHPPLISKVVKMDLN